MKSLATTTLLTGSLIGALSGSACTQTHQNTAGVSEACSRGLTRSPSHRLAPSLSGYQPLPGPRSSDPSEYRCEFARGHGSCPATFSSGCPDCQAFDVPGCNPSTPWRRRRQTYQALPALFRALLPDCSLHLVRDEPGEGVAPCCRFCFNPCFHWIATSTGSLQIATSRV